jgi:hypothetical protein
MPLPPGSGIRYLKTEADLSRETGIDIASPIRFFDLEGLGIDRTRFLADFVYSFDLLSWDTYDVRNWQVQFLKRRFPKQKDRLNDFLVRFFAGDAGLWELRDLIARVTAAERTMLQSVLPHRRRAIATFDAAKEGGGWVMTQKESKSFKQNVDKDDYRALERVYAPASPALVRHQEFQKLLVAMALMIEDAEAGFNRTVERMTLTFHQMGIVTVPGQVVTNSPEGIHKDGADYIVSAIIVERKGVTGGVSVIYGDDKKTKYAEVQLKPGQGIFQADLNSPLWHQVTPVKLARRNARRLGERNIMGFDAVIHRP